MVRVTLILSHTPVTHHGVYVCVCISVCVHMCTYIFLATKQTKTR